MDCPGGGSKRGKGYGVPGLGDGGGGGILHATSRINFFAFMMGHSQYKGHLVV